MPRGERIDFWKYKYYLLRAGWTAVLIVSAVATPIVLLIIRPKINIHDNEEDEHIYLPSGNSELLKPVSISKQPPVLDKDEEEPPRKEKSDKNIEH